MTGNITSAILLSPIMNKKALIVLFSIVATELIGFGLIIPVLPQIASKYDISGLQLGFLLAAYSVAQFFAAPLLGRISDRIGRKKVLVASQIGTVFAYIILAGARSFSVFLIARLLDGFTGGNIATARAYVADVTTDENRPKGMAVIGVAFGVGFILGPALGGILYGLGNTHMVPALVAGSLSLTALLLNLILLKEPEKHASQENLPFMQGLKTTIGNRNIQAILLLQLVFFTVFSGFETTFSIFTDKLFHYTAQQNSLVFLYIGLLMLVIQGTLVRKKSGSPKHYAFTGVMIISVGICLIATAKTLVWLLLALAVFAVGAGLVHAYLPALLTITAGPNNQGQVMGVYESVTSLSRILGPLVAGTLIFQFWRLSYVSLAIVLMAAAWLFLLLFKET